VRGRRALPVLLLGLLASGLFAASPTGPAVAADAPVFEGPVPRADCGPGSSPETGIQGEVTREDRDSGRSQLGYRCNMELVGQYQGQGTTWVSQSYDTCAYHSQAFPSSVTSEAPGVHVVDVSEPKNPVLATRLTSPAFLGNTWETLKVNEERQLLGGVQVGPLLGAAFFDVYDISDCKNPKLLNSVGTDQLSIPSNLLGHEGNWSPDGKTYWSTSLLGGQITAIDVTDPSVPRVIYTNGTGATNHGLSLSPDGNRLYLANIDPNGLVILDVSEVQSRQPAPEVREVGSVFWTDGNTGQHAIRITYGGKPYVLYVDELGSGAARIIDISDETAPRVVSKLKLEIQMPDMAERRALSAGDGVFGYDGHYCEVDRLDDPTAVACGYFESGVRVFDIRDPLAPQEVAYFNPPAQVGKAEQLAGSEHASGIIAEEDLSADWCSSPPRFVAPDQLWVTCQDNGFMVLRFTNGVYPLAAAAPVTAPVTGPVAAAPVGEAPVGEAPASRPGGALPATGAVPLAALAGLGLLSAAAVARRRAGRS
jgi:hypothetical protein